MKKNAVLVVLLATSFTLASANKKMTTHSLKALPPLPLFVLSTDGKSDVDYKISTQMKMTESQKYNRQIAQTDTIDEKGFLTDSFIQIRNQFFAVQSADQLDALINKVSDNEYYNKLDRDGQFLALQLIGLKPYKSVIYRMRTYLGKHTAVRSAIITNLRIAAVAQRNFNSTPEQKAIFDFLTSPMAGMKSDITSDAKLENFLIEEIMPETDKVYRKFTALIHISEKPIHWDNKVYASFANFSDSADRFAQIGIPEQYLILAGFEQTIAGQLVTAAYSLEGFSDMLNSMAKEFGVDSMNPFTKVDGMSAKKRFAILNKYPQLMILKSGGAAYTKAAYGFLKTSLQNTKIAWNFIQRNQTNSQIAFAINPQLFTPFNRQINTGLSNLDALFSDAELSSAVINGDKINISFEKLFTNPPQSLSQFYPTEFNTEKAVLTKTVDGKNFEYRNYLSESATGWNHQNFKTYLPNIKSTNDKTVNIAKELRVLSQVWGANILGVSMGALVF